MFINATAVDKTCLLIVPLVLFIPLRGSVCFNNLWHHASCRWQGDGIECSSTMHWHQVMWSYNSFRGVRRQNSEVRIVNGSNCGIKILFKLVLGDQLQRIWNKIVKSPISVRLSLMLNNRPHFYTCLPHNDRTFDKFGHTIAAQSTFFTAHLPHNRGFSPHICRTF